MDMEYYFHNAAWVGAKERSYDKFSVLYGKFDIKKVEKVTLFALGLGFFRCYINGICVNSDSLLPLSSEYEAAAEPEGEVLSGHRVYVPSFNITQYVKEGENIIAIHYGGGWYTSNVRRFGLPKAIYNIVAQADGEREYFTSGKDCLIGESFICEYNLAKGEAHNYLISDADFSIIPSNAEPAVITEPLLTEYESTDCPVDKVRSSIIPKIVKKCESSVIYDVGMNLSGYPKLKINAKQGDEVRVVFSEAINPDGSLDIAHMHNQSFKVVSDGESRISRIEFGWFGFRYFEVFGDAEVLSVEELTADVKITSSFKSSSETLNWIYETFIHTMLSNMHTGHPSDCPHLERRGYTGDGQITAHAVFSTLGAKDFYKKWLQDIADSQDKISGHIQYTAPFVRSGGGPGGWGCAIVEVPYQFYRHYGETEVLEKYYGNMRRFIDYLEEHSEFGLVTSDMPGRWCLGDWCGPNILYPEKDVTSSNQQVVIPAPMVNTYFMVKSLEKMKYIAKIIGRTEDIPEYDEKIKLRKKAINAAYFNTFDGNFIMNIQGANAYAVDLGLGSESTYQNMVRYYKKLGHYDTGIFATDILTRVLFEHGDCELALELLTQDGDCGFERWRKNGATTFHEYWDSNRSRSHNHPMFGSPVAYFFEYLLGIKQEEDSAAYSKVIIEPKVTKLDFISGSMESPRGNISVEYKKYNGKIEFKVLIPKSTSAKFKYLDKEIPLSEGENIFSV